MSVLTVVNVPRYSSGYCVFFRWLDETYPEFDMLINNAGWQGRQDLTDRQVLHFESDEFEDYELELQHNLEAHIGMTLEACRV